MDVRGDETRRRPQPSESELRTSPTGVGVEALEAVGVSQLRESLRRIGLGAEPVGLPMFPAAPWLPIILAALKPTGAFVNAYRYTDALEGDCGDTKTISLPRSFDKVRVSVTNTGDCTVTATVSTADPSQPKKEDQLKVKGSATAEPGKNCNVDGNGANQVDFKCESQAGQKCKFSFDINSP